MSRAALFASPARCCATHAFEPIQSFLLPAPEREANRAPRLRADRLENAHRLEHRRGAVGVVGGARRRMPRVEVRADHHDLVAQLGIGARKLGDDVVAARVLGEVPTLDVDANLDGNAIFEKSNEIVVMLAGHDDASARRSRRRRASGGRSFRARRGSA